MSTHRRILSAIGGLLLVPGALSAQVDTWHLTYPIPGIEDQIRIGWSTLGTASGATVATLPYLSCVGGVAMSADRSTFYVFAENELLRFDTASRSQLTSLPAPVDCLEATMHISPDDRWWYFLSSVPGQNQTRYQIVDATTRAVVLDVTTEPVVGFVFSPDGSIRFELAVVGYGAIGPNAWRLRARTDPRTTTTAWEMPIACEFCGPAITANAATVYLQIATVQGPGELRAYAAHAGTERARTALPSVIREVRAGRDRLHLGGTRLVTGTCGENIFATLDPVTLELRRFASFPAECLYTYSGFILSQDESILYFATSRGSIIGTITRAEAFASATLRPLAPGTFMRFPVYTGRAIGPPSPEIVSLTASSNSVNLGWQPGSGEPPRAFTIRGAPRGHATITVDETGPAERYWMSPPLPDGSYTVEVTALNLAASSAPSPPVDFSVGDAGVPPAPIELVATTQADVSHLTWRPAPGPAPKEYIVQAAFAGTSRFADIMRASLPELRATRIPAGSWDVRVRAVTETGESPPSNVITVTAAACSARPAAPVGLNAIVTERTVTLRWAPSGSAEEYIVEAGTTAGAIDIVRFPTASPRPSIDTAAPPAAYFVRVRGRNACGESDPSNEIDIVVR